MPKQKIRFNELSGLSLQQLSVKRDEIKRQIIDIKTRKVAIVYGSIKGLEDEKLDTTSLHNAKKNLARIETRINQIQNSMVR